MASGSLGGRLRQLRGQFSQKEFAERLGIAVSTYQHYERDERVPDATLLMRLAETGVDPTWLLTGAGQAIARTAQERVDALVAADRFAIGGSSAFDTPAEPKGVSQPARLDLDKLRFALEVVEEALAESGRTADPAGKAGLVAKIYETFLQEADVAKATATVLRLIRTGT